MTDLKTLPWHTLLAKAFMGEFIRVEVLDQTIGLVTYPSDDSDKATVLWAYWEGCGGPWEIDADLMLPIETPELRASIEKLLYDHERECHEREQKDATQSAVGNLESSVSQGQ